MCRCCPALGAIPESLGGLTNLTTLRLHGNKLTGCVAMVLRFELWSERVQESFADAVIVAALSKDVSVCGMYVRSSVVARMINTPFK